MRTCGFAFVLFIWQIQVQVRTVQKHQKQHPPTSEDVPEFDPNGQIRSCADQVISIGLGQSPSWQEFPLLGCTFIHVVYSQFKFLKQI